MSDDDLESERITRISDRFSDYKEWIKQSIKRLFRDVDKLESTDLEHAQRLSRLEADRDQHQSWIKTIEHRQDQQSSAEYRASPTPLPKPDKPDTFWQYIFSDKVLPWVVVVILIALLMLHVTGSIPKLVEAL